MLETVNYALGDLIDWLEYKATGMKRIKIIILGFMLIMAIVNTGGIIITLLNLSVPANPSGSITAAVVSENSMPILSAAFAAFLVLAAMMEEVVFRAVPLGLTIVVTVTVVFLLKRAFDWETDGQREVIKMALLVAIPVSFIFGILHGGFINIFIQGLGGYILCLVYLKCGGAQSGSVGDFVVGSFQGLLASSTAHFLLNSAIFLLGVVLGGLRYYTPT